MAHLEAVRPRRAPARPRAGNGHATLNEQAYRRIRQGIQNGTLGRGAALSEGSLARHLGISRTPVREALKRLAVEGLVEVFPRRGTFVSVPDMDAVREIFQVREAVEGLAARLAAPRHDASELAALRARLEAARRARDAETVFALGREFHEWIIRQAGNRRLTEYLNTLQSQIHAVVTMGTRLQGQMERSADEYRAIMDALRRRDGDAAEAAMRRHIGSVRDNLLAA